jgi:hypothetical protein
MPPPENKPYKPPYQFSVTIGETCARKMRTFRGDEGAANLLQQFWVMHNADMSNGEPPEFFVPGCSPEEQETAFEAMAKRLPNAMPVPETRKSHLRDQLSA